MGYGELALYYPIFGGENRQDTDVLRQDEALLELVTAQNVIPDPLGHLATAEGFSNVRATAITGTPAITGMKHLGDRADELILTASDGNVYRDNANPPNQLVGGTSHTTGNTVLSRFDVGGAAGSEIAVIVTSSRDVPRKVTISSMALANLAGTPARGVDFHVWGRRPWMFAPTDGTTVRSGFASFGSLDDDLETWANPYTTNRLNFGRPGQRVNVLGAEKYKDRLMCFTEDSIFPIYQTPNADLPFAFQDDLLNEEGGGPVTIQSVVSANDRLYWISRNFDVKELYGSTIRSIGYPVQPFLRGLNDARRNAVVGGFEPKYRLVFWAVSDGSDTTNQDVLMLQVDTRHFFFRTFSLCSMAHRVVSGDFRLLGGHYNGLFSNLFDGSTTGDLQSATAAIDADVIVPRLHLGMPGVVKKVPYGAVVFDPIGSEAVTVQTRLDDATTWATPTGFPVTLSGTDVVTSFFEIDGPFDRISVRLRDNNSGERYRAKALAFPRPRAVRMLMS